MMRREFRFISLFACILSAIFVLPDIIFPKGVHLRFYEFGIGLSLIIAVLYILAFVSINRLALFLLWFATFTYLFSLPFDYLDMPDIALFFTVILLLFEIATIGFGLIYIVMDVMDKDIVFFEKLKRILFEKSHSFYLFLGGRDEKKLQAKNS